MITVCNMAVSCKDNAKYLGIKIPCGRRHFQNVYDAKQRGVTAAVGCLKLISRVGITDLKLALQFYNSLVDSVIKYGMAAGYPGSAWSILDSVYYNFIRSFMKLPPAARNDVIGRLTGFTCSQCSYGLETILYCRRLVSQRGPELAYSIIREMWHDQNSSWLSALINYGTLICPEAFRGLSPDKMFDDLEFSLTKISKQQWIRSALQHCQSNCLMFNTGTSESKNQLLRSIIPGFIGLHWVFKKKSPRSRATLLILTGSWRWAHENLSFLDVSRICHYCRVKDSMRHLLLECLALKKERDDLLLSLSGFVKSVNQNSTLVEEVLAKALSDVNGTELINDFCFAALSHRRKRWEGEILVGLNDPLNDILTAVRNLFN
jgi:hypothetical protein